MNLPESVSLSSLLPSEGRTKNFNFKGKKTSHNPRTDLDIYWVVCLPSTFHFAFLFFVEFMRFLFGMGGERKWWDGGHFPDHLGCSGRHASQIEALRVSNISLVAPAVFEL